MTLGQEATGIIRGIHTFIFASCAPSVYVTRAKVFNAVIVLRSNAKGNFGMVLNVHVAVEVDNLCMSDSVGIKFQWS